VPIAYFINYMFPKTKC